MAETAIARVERRARTVVDLLITKDEGPDSKQGKKENNFIQKKVRCCYTSGKREKA